MHILQLEVHDGVLAQVRGRTEVLGQHKASAGPTRGVHLTSKYLNIPKKEYFVHIRNRTSNKIINYCK